MKVFPSKKVALSSDPLMLSIKKRHFSIICENMLILNNITFNFLVILKMLYDIYKAFALTMYLFLSSMVKEEGIDAPRAPLLGGRGIFLQKF